MFIKCFKSKSLQQIFLLNLNKDMHIAHILIVTFLSNNGFQEKKVITVIKTV